MEEFPRREESKSLHERKIERGEYETVEINGRKFWKVSLRDVLEIGPEDSWPVGVDGRPINSEREYFSHNGPGWDQKNAYCKDRGVIMWEKLSDDPYLYMLVEN